MKNISIFSMIGRIYRYTTKQYHDLVEITKEDYNNRLDDKKIKHMKVIKLILDEPILTHNIFSLYLSDDVTVARRRSPERPFKVINIKFTDKKSFLDFTKKYYPIGSAEPLLNFLNKRYGIDRSILDDIEEDNDIKVIKNDPCKIQ